MAENENKKSWFARHKVLSAILGLILIVVIAGAAGGSEDTASNNSNGNTNSSDTSKSKNYRFAERADKQEKDVEVLPGEPATVGGVKMTLSNVEYKTSLSEYETADEGKTYIVADVVLENISDRTRPYNAFDFRVQTAGGQVLDGTFASLPSPLNSGDVVSGGTAKGQIVFEVPVEEGHQYVIWKPGFESSRAVIQVK